MKTKLTLTVNGEIIEKARKYSEATGKSISQLFEEFFESATRTKRKSASQLAAERLLKKIAAADPVKQLNDKSLLKEQVARKYA